jgi:hypothetical protein
VGDRKIAARCARVGTDEAIATGSEQADTAMTIHDDDCECKHVGHEGLPASIDCDLCACMPLAGTCRWEEIWGDHYAGGINTCRDEALSGSDRCARHGGTDLHVRLTKCSAIARLALSGKLRYAADRDRYKRVLDKLFPGKA